jgi:hypothetical protein
MFRTIVAAGRSILRVSLITGLVLLDVAPAFAQRDRLLVEPSPPAHWAVTFSLTPRWDIYPIGLSGFAGAERVEIEGPDGRSSMWGSNWSIGFARGRALGRDWGISFARQDIRKDAVIDRTYGLAGRPCFPNTCIQGERVVFQDVSVIGPEAHLYVPFFTIKERVQVGLMMAGGIGKFTGTAFVDNFEQDITAQPIPPNFQLPIIRTQRQGPIGEVADVIYYDGSDWTATGRIQPGAAVIVSQALKLHVGAGFHYPGTTYFSMRATYFFPRAAP